MVPAASSAFAVASRGPSIVENRGDCDALAPMSAHRLGDLIDSFLIERYGSDIGPRIGENAADIGTDALGSTGHASALALNRKTLRPSQL